jgi:hypothetical protein
MTLVSSGTIRMSDINVELGRSSTANISLDTAENGGYGAINTNSASRPSGTNPASMSEWYGYNHNAAGQTYPINITFDGYTGFTNMYVHNTTRNILVTGTPNQQSISATLNGSTAGDSIVVYSYGYSYSGGVYVGIFAADPVTFFTYLFSNNSGTPEASVIGSFTMPANSVSVGISAYEAF